MHVHFRKNNKGAALCEQPLVIRFKSMSKVFEMNVVSQILELFFAHIRRMEFKKNIYSYKTIIQIRYDQCLVVRKAECNIKAACCGICPLFIAVTVSDIQVNGIEGTLHYTSELEKEIIALSIDLESSV